jgi:hypothetical protein
LRRNNPTAPGGRADPPSREARSSAAELSAKSQDARPGHVRHRFPLVVVPCSRAKLDTPAPAGRLYTGPLHLAARRAAERMRARRVLVLSARHGLVDLDTVIEPYDLAMGDPGSVVRETLARQAAALREPPDTPFVVLLLPRAYAQAVEDVWPSATNPLAGARSRGEQLHRLSALALRPGEA